MTTTYSPVAKMANAHTHGDTLQFTLSNVNTSYANAIRRTIITDIPVAVFRTTPYTECKVNITANTTRLHNEIIKQRLSCIPVHIKAGSAMCKNLANYVVEMNVENKTDTMMVATTNHFRIKDLAKNEYIDAETTKQIFPPFVPASGTHEYFIDIVKLRPKISNEIAGEKLVLSAELVMSTAKENSSFNATGTCAYGFTPDTVAGAKELAIREQKWKDEGLNGDKIKFNAANWKLLEGMRYVVNDSFDFTLQTVGIYENEEIMRMACEILLTDLSALSASIDDDTIKIKTSENILDSSYDIILENEDYTIGNMLNHEIYALFYNEIKNVDFVGYKKIHPHDNDSVLRVSMVNNTEGRDGVKSVLKTSVERAIATIKAIKKLF